MKAIPKCFGYYFQPVVQIHNYPTKFAANNIAVVKFNKILPNDQYDKPEVNFEIKCLKKLKVVFI